MTDQPKYHNVKSERFSDVFDSIGRLQSHIEEVNTKGYTEREKQLQKLQEDYATLVQLGSKIQFVTEAVAAIMDTLTHQQKCSDNFINRLEEQNILTNQITNKVAEAFSDNAEDINADDNAKNSRTLGETSIKSKLGQS